MNEDLEGLCLLVCIFEILLLIGVCVCIGKSLHKNVEHSRSMLGQTDISSLIWIIEASNGGFLGGHMIGLCVDL